MDKKIFFLSLLLLFVIAITIVYIVYNQDFFAEEQDNYVPDDGEVSQQNISDEIDDFFISEDEEIEIGEMV